MMVDSWWTCILTLLATVSPVALQTDGGFSQWSTWTLPSCAVTCGALATAKVQRTRACNNPPPSNGGSNCIGPFAETAVVNCNLLDCPVCVPVNGGFSQWTRWTNPSCPVTCGSSATRRVQKTRRCDSPLPNKCGLYCIGVAYRYEDRNCQLPDCQDDVGFNEWGRMDQSNL
ncbi:thrombospondin-2-like [Haliotis rubra]|uniref:thrombospondin-2-like n=1 Tax=Haliotis rubra TaxID=36100 RepID=UPI001EE62647|nr:thrombospondin-2-like [Haliotis rubra]